MSDKLKEIPELATIPWSIAFSVSWASLRRRFLRALITMIGVILAIAFLAYMLVTDNILKSLVAFASEDAALTKKLQATGVDVLSSSGDDQMMYLLIGLSLMICLVGIVNAMLMAVTERVKEIGTLKCLGALDGFIVKTYFIESSLQGIIGTTIGLIIGVGVALGVAGYNYGGYTFDHFPVGRIAISLITTFIIGSAMSIGASIIPAYIAAKKEPVEAMRVEE